MRMKRSKEEDKGGKRRRGGGFKVDREARRTKQSLALSSGGRRDG